MQQFLKAVEMIILDEKKEIFYYFCSTNRFWVPQSEVLKPGYTFYIVCSKTEIELIFARTSTLYHGSPCHLKIVILYSHIACIGVFKSSCRMSV